MVLSLGSGCRHHTEDKSGKPLVVRTAKVAAKEIVTYEKFTGRTDAVESVDLRARVTGYLFEIKFKPGAPVKKDQPLFQIDPRPYKADLDRANAQILLAKARLKLAIADYERGKEIDKTPGAISKQDLDKYAASQSEAEASVKAAEAEAEKADLDLKFTTVISSIDGIIGRNLITIGNLVNKDTTSLATIVSEDPMYGYFDVDERTVLRIEELIRQGKVKSAKTNEIPVELGLANEPDKYPHTGTIDFINNQLDASTGTMQVRGVFPNPEPKKGGPRPLAAGMFIRVRFPVGEKEKKLLVPQIAIGTDQGKKYVLVVTDKNVVEQRPVTLGPPENDWQVVDPVKIMPSEKGIRRARSDEQGEDSLRADEQVIIGGLQRVRPGV